MALQHYQELTVWQRAMDLAVQAYQLTTSFPKEEIYGFTSQLRRAATSISLNIAEDYGRDHRTEYIRFLSIARGSCCEVETILILVGRLELASREELNPIWGLTQQVGKMLRTLQDRLKQNTDADNNASGKPTHNRQ